MLKKIKKNQTNIYKLRYHFDRILKKMTNDGPPSTKNQIYFGLNQEGKYNLTLPLKEIMLSPNCSNALNIDKIESVLSHKLISNGYESLSDENKFDDEDDNDWSIQLFLSEDAHLLKCKGTSMDPYIIMKNHKDDDVDEHLNQDDTLHNTLHNMFGLKAHTKINLHWYDTAEPAKIEKDLNLNDQHSKEEGISYDGEWGCLKHTGCIDFDTNLETNEEFSDVKIIDMTPFQRNMEKYRNQCNDVHLHKPGTIFHMMRSLLTCRSQNSHSMSPWNAAYTNSSNHIDSTKTNNKHNLTNGTYFNNNTVGIILSDSFDSQYDSIVIEKIISFRVGDASPSFYLHSAVRLQFSSKLPIHQQIETLLSTEIKASNENYNDDVNDQDVILLIYRLIPPRTHLTSKLPLIDKNYKIIDTTKEATPTCLWEAFIENQKHDENNDHEAILSPVLNYRQVSPPYQSIQKIYPDIPIIESLLTPQNLSTIIQEATSIPQWTAWPETQHYNNNNENDEPSWTVFPLCHTFPANDITKRKFISSTCAHVPRTTDLLKQYLGTALRTALFSRLDPETTLAPHTGWKDLANHVLRLHIPLVVPSGNYCGTWVDGCVENQCIGKVLCFDDSKVHRAFNYSQEERIVLIVDLIRNVEGNENSQDTIPLGTATGGHSDELDAFIQQLS